MARCMLCSSAVGEADVVCPRCGGAVEDDPADATHVAGIDLTKTEAPATGPTGPVTGPFATVSEPNPWADAPPLFAPPPQPYGPPSQQYGQPYGPPQDGPPQGYGPPPSPTFGPPIGAPPGPYAYGPAPGPWYGGPIPYGPPPTPTEGLAIGAFLTSLLGLVLAGSCLVPILACPVGAVLGHVALRRIEETGKQGRGFALAGIIIGWIATALLVLGTAGFVAVLLVSEPS